eukprot:7732970-Pyramimonas_sp.AAC.1
MGVRPRTSDVLRQPMSLLSADTTPAADRWFLWSVANAMMVGELCAMINAKTPNHTRLTVGVPPYAFRRSKAYAGRRPSVRQEEER